VSFDRVAPHYRWLETLVFGNQLQQARIEFVGEIESPRRVLIVGEGNGRFLAEFVRSHPGAVVDCIEASGRMIELARRKKGNGRPNFVQEDIRKVPLQANHYDLIVTHFVLDCFAGDALREVVEQLADAANSRASWLLADFTEPAGGWRRWHARLWLGAMYLFFRLTSNLQTRRLDDPSALLCAAGFDCVRRNDWRFGLIKSELWRHRA
jgi:ubiquinone/menaquinone biosynthesis C-methylase UbiE